MGKEPNLIRLEVNTSPTGIAALNRVRVRSNAPVRVVVPDFPLPTYEGGYTEGERMGAHTLPLSVFHL